MAASPARSSGNSSLSAATSDCQEADIFSDDSGVDLRPQSKSVEPTAALNLVLPDSRRNKRKSSEPKRRNDVLQMKRFRWDTDEEMEEEGQSNSELEDSFYEGERPSSGDSGCQVELVPATSRKKKSKKPGKSPLADECPLNFAKPTVPSTPRQSVIRRREAPSAIPSTNSTFLGEPKPSAAKELLGKGSSGSAALLATADYEGPQRSGARPRNYKSMSRQRRIEANARERTRVHTISAAFESLRRAVPAYAHNQKLSKLAILRIASAYIVALACLTDQDYSQEQNNPSLADCMEQCTRTIQAEGRSRRRS